MSIISDIDIAKVEAEVFSLAVYEGQKRCGGTNGIVAGTQFTASGVDFSAAQVTAGCVIYLESVDGSIKGVFEIVSVIDSTHLTVSQIRSDAADAAIPIGSASGLTWKIKTLGPQIARAEVQLSLRLELLPGKPDAAYALDEALNAEAIQAMLTAALLVDVYTVLTTATTDATVRSGYEQKRTWYQQRYEQLAAMVHVEVPVEEEV